MLFETSKDWNFYPRPPRGGRPRSGSLYLTASREFLSTPSARRATLVVAVNAVEVIISIHALREEGDGNVASVLVELHKFLSTPSARRATRTGADSSMRPSNFYPRPPRGGRLTVEVDDPDIFEISIHALREEGDHFPPVVFEVVLEFLSTPSARRATRRPPETQGAGADFYPRPPRGGRLPLCAGCKTAEKFLSTPSARRATLLALSSVMGTPIFLSTPSARRATRGGEKTMSKIEISIHALREEGDQAGRLWVFEGRTFLSTPSARRATVKDEQGRVYHKNFYPRPPRGGRPLDLAAFHLRCEFLSTPSARRATCGLDAAAAGGDYISIHALREEGDRDDRHT